MMLAPSTSSLALWLLAITTASCFNFTGPAPGSALNLSAASIPIQWSADNTPYAQLDLFFHGQTPSGTGFSYGIAQNLSLSAGQYSWQPANISDALQQGNTTLTAGDDFYLKAQLHNANDSAGATVDSDHYTVAGYPKIGAAAALQPHLGAALLMGGVAFSFALGIW